MDRFIEAFAGVADGDLVLCFEHGVAYQRDMSASVPYDGAYFDKYAGYEGQEIATRINHGRVGFVNFHVGAAAEVLDVGIGSGEFIKRRPHTFGFDINPKAQAWLKDKGLWSANIEGFRAFSFWDVIEHIPEPDEYFSRMRMGSWLFTCLPVFGDLHRIRASKHYRPNEHFYYWSEEGFVAWMKLHGFCMMARQRFETEVGRDSITSFAFVKA